MLNTPETNIITIKDFGTVLKALRNYKVKDAAIEGNTQEQVDEVFKKLCIIQGIALSDGYPQTLSLINT